LDVREANIGLKKLNHERWGNNLKIFLRVKKKKCYFGFEAGAVDTLLISEGSIG